MAKGRTNRGKSRQTGFEELTCFLVIELEVPSQFQGQPLAFGEIASLFPADQGPSMNPESLG